MEPIENPDTQNESPAYWEKVLVSHGLGQSRGKSSHKVSLRGGIKELVIVEQLEYEKGSGKVNPSGTGPEN